MRIGKEEMEDGHWVNSPRRILSFSKKRRATVSFLDPDDKASSGFGPKTTEVYGFVGCITTVAATGLFLVWAYVPERCLHSIGIYYYPSRYWALAVPAYSIVAIVLALSFYIGLNFMSTPSSTSLNTMFDEFSREPSDFALEGDEDERPIEPISDIGIHEINAVMFK
ncbi:hypothetical protein EZV62_009447 [Acer yangbiense]|uniref:PIG-P domain-containing protein n=1 Tax=Acer yangbiense TaxID=1000413 RepID=A0A5C7HZ49_9ROSI|nr:hypothetical protein EZV62_009447 [Acer yangbiense]